MNIAVAFLPIGADKSVVFLLQVCVNSLLCGGAILVSGGNQSPFWILLVCVIVAASFYAHPRLTYLSAGIGIVITILGLFLASLQAVNLLEAVVRSSFLAGCAWSLSFRTVRLLSVSNKKEDDPEGIKKRFSIILDTATDSIIAVNNEFQILLFNRAAENSFGYSSEEAKTIPLTKLLRAEYFNLEERFRNLHTQQANPACDRFEIVCIRSDGGSFPADVSVSCSEENGFPFYTLVLKDITEQKQSEEAFQQANAKLTNWVNELELRNRESLLLNEMGDILQACLNPEEAYTAISETVQHLFPLGFGIMGILNSSRTMVVMQAAWGKGDLLPEEQIFAPADCWALRRGRPNLISESESALPCHHVHQTSPNGYLCVPLLAQGEALGLLHIRGLPPDPEARDRLQQLVVTLAEHISLSLSNLRLRETLRVQSVRDPLTGLYNRRYMEESFERELARAARAQHALGVIMMDIDHFKRFNDTYGHAAGDALLKELGAFTQKRMRSSDIACRYGGEEFTFILPEASLEDTLKKAELVRNEISTFKFQSPILADASVTVSLGVSGFPKHGSTSEELLHAADAALYQAKHEGRNRVVTAQT